MPSLLIQPGNSASKWKTSHKSQPAALSSAKTRVPAAELRPLSPENSLEYFTDVHVSSPAQDVGVLAPVEAEGGRSVFPG